MVSLLISSRSLFALLVFAVTTSKVAGNSFSRSGDPKLHCYACKGEGTDPCPAMTDTVNQTCSTGSEACVRWADNSVLKISGRRSGWNMEIVGGFRSCLDRVLIEQKELFRIPNFSTNKCYRNLNIDSPMKGAPGEPDSGRMEFRGDVCICTSDYCNGSDNLHQQLNFFAALFTVFCAFV